MKMKKIFFVAVASLLLSSCFPFYMDYWYCIVFYNNTGEKIIVYPSSCGNDTLLLGKRTSIAPHTTEIIYEGPDDDFLEELYKKSGEDTICWVVTDSNDSILQGYYLSLSDAEYFSKPEGHLSFPPTPEMRNIKMWPPYGTYDPLGHPVR